MRLYFVTRNTHKLEEASRILAPIQVERGDPAKVEIRSDNLEDIVSYAADRIQEDFGEPFFVEDAGLFVHVLGGYPGPYSSGIFKLLGHEGLLKLLHDKSDRTAVFRSVVALVLPESQPRTFTGEVEGSIASAPRGKHGFDYDSLFIPEDGEGRTFGEMSVEEKNLMSHRSRSLNQLKSHLQAGGTANPEG